MRLFVNSYINKIFTRSSKEHVSPPKPINWGLSGRLSGYEAKPIESFCVAFGFKSDR